MLSMRPVLYYNFVNVDNTFVSMQPVLYYNFVNVDNTFVNAVYAACTVLQLC